MLKLVVALITLLAVCSNAIPDSAVSHLHKPNKTIYRALKRLRSDLPEEQAIKYSEILDCYSKEYQIDWRIVLAIFKQESNFNIKAVNYDSLDFGIGQMHYKTIKSRNIDLATLLTNDAYAIKETYKLLDELRNKYAKIDNKNGQRWYTRYHSFTPSFRNSYAVLLKHHLAKLEGFDNERSANSTKLSRDGAKREKTTGKKAFRGIAEEHPRNM